MFISPAYAQGAGGGGFDITTLLPLVLIFVVFYFLLIRPQQKKAKDHRAMLGKLQRGDKIVTNGGIVGQIRKVVSENELDLEIAKGVRVRVVRSMISTLYARSDDRDDEGKAANENK